jgi:hypothetical protein
MKKLMFCLVILITSSCFCQNTETLDDAKLTKFANDLTKLPFSERDVILKACKLFEQEFKGDKESADWGFQILYYYHELSCEDKTTTLHKTFSDEEIRELKIGDIYGVLPMLKGEMKDFQKEYAKYGYRIMSFEDTSYCIEVNPAFLYERLKDYLTKDYAYYKGNWVKEYDEVPYWHAKLIVPINEVMRRIAWRDELLDSKKDFSRNDLVTREIEGLSFIVTKGLENTPIYDKNDVILKEYKNALQNYYRNHTNTTWGLYYTEFIHRLALNKYRNSNDIDQYVIKTLFPPERKNIDPLLKYEDILIDNLME